MKTSWKIQWLLLAFILCFALLPSKEAKAYADATCEEMTNCVILVRPKGSSEFVDSSLLSTLDQMYNTSPISLKNYYLEESLGKLKIDTSIITGINSITLDHSADYYAPKYSFNEARGVYEEINS